MRDLGRPIPTPPPISSPPPLTLPSLPLQTMSLLSPAESAEHRLGLLDGPSSQPSSSSAPRAVLPATFSLTPEKLSSTQDFTHNAQGCLRRGEGAAQQRPPTDRAWDRLPTRKLNAFLSELHARKDALLSMSYGEVSHF